ncbi:FHA domain-containing protein [Dactylosporangium cerinum]|uniref:FHA domain-containing protein n=1 Tax=Dactylosporangium cerinum TaxID=1434730 RepID=A0ABV9WJW4_9ACTN
MPADERVCRACRSPLEDRYCEHCGHDSLAPDPLLPDAAPAAREPRSWLVVAAADRSYYDTVWEQAGPKSQTVAFPPYYPARRFPLTGPQALIGRRSVRRGIDPEIDLTGPPEDVGVSHTHALLSATPDGTWVVVDLGSANGTFLNGDYDTPLRKETPVPLGHGDRIHVGAWTVLTLQAVTGAARPLQEPFGS